MHPYIIILYGPTGVGKSDVAERVAHAVGGEIVNLDMAQCYTQLTIGTAKPDYKKSEITHHLFDSIDEPRRLTVTEYRKRVSHIITDIWNRKKIPILVGGSSFYMSSLFYPPISGHDKKPVDSSLLGLEEDRWQRLHALDPERAKKIHPHDMYRVNRALEIILTHDTKASLYAPVYQPIAPYYIGYINRDRDDLYARIDQRVLQMIEMGWIDEVAQLRGTPWESFLKEKKIIGYDDILNYLYGEKTPQNYTALIASIQKKTRNYAKRQRCFARSFFKKIEKSRHEVKTFPGVVQECNLTLTPIDLYLKELLPHSLARLVNAITSEM